MPSSVILEQPVEEFIAHTYASPFEAERHHSLDAAIHHSLDAVSDDFLTLTFEGIEIRTVLMMEISGTIAAQVQFFMDEQ